MTPVEGSQILVTLGQVLASGYAPAPPARVTTLASTGQDGVEDGARWPGRQGGLDRLGRELGLAWIDQVAKEALRLARNISGWPDYFPSPA